jgi:hypothetical protein
LGYILGSISSGVDCNDNNAQISGGALEVCGNNIDDNCNGLIDEGCLAGTPAIDNITSALNIPSTANWFPQCQLYSGDCALSSNSTESTIGSGVDNWYRFTASSTVVSIEMFSSTMDNCIELVQQTGPSTYASVNFENATPAIGGTERLNYQGLVVGQTYYVAVGAVGSGVGGAYQLCIKQLLPSSCNTNVSLPLSNCATFKATWTGANTYTYQFLPVGASIGGGSLTAQGSISLSNPSLNIVPGNTYNVIINATYHLTNGAGASETFTVFGANPSCANVQIAAHPFIDVRSSQRCSAPATLLRTSFLRTDPFVCGVTNYTFEFQAVTDCEGSIVAGLPFTYNSNSRIISLNFSGTQTTPAGQTIASQAYYRVRVRPNFSTAGVNPGVWGNPQVIFIGGSLMADYTDGEEQPMLAYEMLPADLEVYPNPGNGSVIQLASSDMDGEVRIELFDQFGRLVAQKVVYAESGLQLQWQMDQPLASGLYHIRVLNDGDWIDKKYLVTR